MDDAFSSTDFICYYSGFKFQSWLLKMIQRALGQAVLAGLVNKELNILADLYALTVVYSLAKITY